MGRGSEFSSRTRSSSISAGVGIGGRLEEALYEVLEEGETTNVEEVAEEDEELEEKEGDKLGPMPGPAPSAPSSRTRSPVQERRPDSPEQRRKESKGPDSATAAGVGADVFVGFGGGTFASAPIPQQTDPVVAYSRRSSMFLPSRTNSTYSLHRAQYSEDHGSTAPSTSTIMGGGGLVQTPGESSIAFPTSPPEYIRPGRVRTASTISYGSGAWPGVPEGGVVGGRRKLLRTLSTVSVYESGEGFAGGLADVAPIGKFIVEQDRTGEDINGLKSGMPKELLPGGKGSASVSNESIAAMSGKEEKRPGGGGGAPPEGEKKRRFIID